MLKSGGIILNLFDYKLGLLATGIDMESIVSVSSCSNSCLGEGGPLFTCCQFLMQNFSMCKEMHNMYPGSVVLNILVSQLIYLFFSSLQECATWKMLLRSNWLQQVFSGLDLPGLLFCVSISPAGEEVQSLWGWCPETDGSGGSHCVSSSAGTHLRHLSPLACHSQESQSRLMSWCAVWQYKSRSSPGQG